jgi:hypothetical protein
MKRGILTDLHSISPTLFVDRMRRQGIDGFAFLGDDDDPGVLREILDLQYDKVIVPGNHDYGFCMDMEFSSKDVGNRFGELVRKWKIYDEREFVIDAIDALEGEKEGIRIVRPEVFGNVIYTHSQIGPTVFSSFWDRLAIPITNADAICDNFLEMGKRDAKIMFRGHDHVNRIFSGNLGGEDFMIHNFSHGKPFVFERDRRYIVSVGAFKVGDFAIFDNEHRSVILDSI